MDSQPAGPSGSKPRQRPRRFRFGLLTLLLVVTLLSIAAALLGHLLRQGADSSTSGLFVLLAAAAPMGLMILISVGQLVARTLRRHR